MELSLLFQGSVASQELLSMVRDSPYEPRRGAKFCAFPPFWQDGRVAWAAAVTLGSPNGCRAADLAVFPGI